MQPLKTSTEKLDLQRVGDTKPTTMQDVARLVGVTPMTVSRALSGREGISQEMRETVLRAAEQLNYRPHLSARSMKSRKSSLIGALVQNNPDNQFTHPLVWEFMLGINQELERGGYMMSLIRISDVARSGRVKANAFEGHLLDGLIVVNQIPPELEERIEKLVPHCIWLDSNVWREECCIRRDEVQAGKIAAQAMIDLGYRNLLCVGCAYSSSPRRSHHYSYADRTTGIRAIAEGNGISVLEFALPDNQSESLRSVLPHLRPDTALIVADAYTAHAFGYFLLSGDLRPGVDFALASCDDYFHGSGHSWEELSRVSFDRTAMGKQASAMLLNRIENPDECNPSKLITSHWVPGRTARPYR